MTYFDWIEERQTHEKEKLRCWTVEDGNKMVKVFYEKYSVFIQWSIDGRMIKDAEFPIDDFMEMQNYLQTLYHRCISEELMNEIVHKMGKYLPHLQDGEHKDNFKNWKLVAHVNMEEE